MKKLTLLLTVLGLLAAACGTPEPPATPSLTASPTLLPTETPTHTITPLQPTLTVTPLLIDGILTLKVNVRSGPGTSFDSLGQLEAGAKVQVAARDSQGTWYQILYPSAPQGRGWVTSQYVTLAAGSQVPLDATPTPTGPTGRVIQRLNVRSGPGTTFNSLGLLEAGGIVFLTGKNTTASWFQVEYPAGPGGHGWVTSQYIQVESTVELPVLDDYGNLVTPGAAGTPPGTLLPPTPTLGPASPDGDSSANPAINVIFSATGTHKFTYSSQVSTPQGDDKDWVAFTPYSASGTHAHLVFSLECAGNGTLTVELWQGSSLLSGWGTLACGDAGIPILLPVGQVYRMSLTPVAGAGLQLVVYTLVVQNNP